MEVNMLVLAHRGMGKGRYENTLKSFKEGLGHVAHGIETDVRLTGDGVVILSHDATLKRTMGLETVVAEKTLGELDSMGLIGEDGLTTLEELYRTLPGDKYFDVEIKAPEAVPGVIDIVRKFDALDRTMFSSFHHECLDAFRKAFGDKTMIAPIIDREVLKEGAEEFLDETVKKYRPFALNLNKELFNYMGIERGREMLEKFRAEGVKISLWTLNDPELFAQVRDVCDYLITDRSDIMMQFCRNH